MQRKHNCSAIQALTPAATEVWQYSGQAIGALQARPNFKRRHRGFRKLEDDILVMDLEQGETDSQHFREDQQRKEVEEKKVV